MRRALVFADWLVENPPPDLQALVEKYGDYFSIPQDVWDQFHKDVDQWRDKLRTRDRG